MRQERELLRAAERLAVLHRELEKIPCGVQDPSSPGSPDKQGSYG